MRHFEKKGALGLYRRFDVVGSTLKVTLGVASDGENTIPIRCGSASEAARAADAWARWAIDWGYTEVALPPGVPGIVRSLASPTGPGRIRIDPCEDVYFKSSPVPFEIGDRAVGDGIHEVGRPKAPFMFGSKFVCDTIVPFPRTKWVGPKPDLSEKRRRALMSMAGSAIDGHQDHKGLPRSIRPGTLILAYEKGIHRFLHMGSGRMVTYEPVLTSTFKRQSYRESACIERFCEPVPPKLRGEIERHFGLGLR